MELTGATTVVGVMGDPVAHSLSPAMHNEAFRALGMNWVYVPFHVKAAAVGQAVESVRALGLAGVNVTVPHKVAVMNYLDEIDDEAKLVGAVNTIVRREERLIGYNTDGRGFVRSLQEQGGRNVKGADVVIVGAGGAAQSVAFSLARAGAADITITNRTVDKAVNIAQTVADAFATPATGVSAEDEAALEALARADIVVQATSLGMHPYDDVPPPPWVDHLRPDALVADIVYNPRQTSLIRAARQHGCDVLTGEGMLVYQGAVAFELWTGVTAPADLMLTTLQRLLNGAHDG